jgi:hypothetical protein
MGGWIEGEFLSYRVYVIPKDAPNIQIIESRRAFYAGAQSMLGTLLRLLGPGTEPSQADLALMDQIKAELDDFNARVAGGRA